MYVLACWGISVDFTGAVSRPGGPPEGPKNETSDPPPFGVSHPPCETSGGGGLGFRFGALFGLFLGGLLGVSCGVLGGSWPGFGLSWGGSGVSWVPLGASWGALGRLLGALGRVLGAPEVSWPVFWVLFACFWGAFRSPGSRKMEPPCLKFPFLLAVPRSTKFYRIILVWKLSHGSICSSSEAVFYDVAEEAIRFIVVFSSRSHLSLSPHPLMRNGFASLSCWLSDGGAGPNYVVCVWSLLRGTRCRTVLGY